MSPYVDDAVDVEQQQAVDAKYAPVVRKLREAVFDAEVVEQRVERREAAAAEVWSVVGQLQSLYITLVPQVSGPQGAKVRHADVLSLLAESGESIRHLSMLARSVEAAARIAPNVEPHDPQSVVDEVHERRPLPYCDASKDAVKCPLEPAVRQSLRTRIRDNIGAIRDKWGLAITHVRIDEVSDGDVQLEKKIAQALLGVFVDVIGAALGAGLGARAVAGVAVRLNNPGFKDGASAAMTDEGTQVGFSQVWNAIKPDAVAIPDDSSAIIHALKEQPHQWAHLLLSNADQLLDAELNSVDKNLSELNAGQSIFEQRIRSVLTRSKKQLKAINHVTHAAWVMGARGGRMALISPEMKERELPMGREFRDGQLRTGKFALVEWIDKDIEPLAWDATMRTRATSKPAELYVSALDTKFWSEAALERVREGMMES